MNLPIDVAVYAEHSDTLKPVQPGWNVRVFNRIEVQEGAHIRVDTETGVITLGPGVYHITGSSLVTYNDLDPHPSGAGWPTKSRPNGGYCRLRYATDAADARNEQAIVVGTISNANMVPSLIDTYLEVARHAEIVLEHQVGDEVEGIYLQDNSNNSSWHVFARMAIQRA